MLYTPTMAPMVPLFAAIALAAMRRRDRKLIDRFRDARAMDEGSAKTRSEIGDETSRSWNRLERHGVVRTTAAGLVWFDEAAWDALFNRRRFVAIGVVLIIVLVGLTTYLSVQ